MTMQDKATLSELSDSGQTVAHADEDVRGRKVKDKDGKDIGKVDDLLIDDQEHKVRFLRVDHSGFLGLGETKSFIPIEAITRITKDEVHINHSAGHVANAPRYDPDLIDDQNYYDDIYGYYGYRPFLGLGSPYPD